LEKNEMTIEIGSAKRGTNGMVEVTMDVRTSAGKMILPFKFPDQGSARANEKRAYDELKVWLQETQEALEARGSTPR
jgi:hypothetical protein